MKIQLFDAIEFVKNLNDLGIRLSLEKEEIICKAPPGVLTLAIADQIREHKAAILRLLRSSGFDRSSMRKLSRCSDREYYPTSSQQKRLYALQQLDLSGTMYNMPGVYVLSDEVDIERLQGAVNAVIERHEVLRTHFEVIDGVLIQRVYDQVFFKVEVEEVHEDNVEEKVIAFIRAFDLNKAPLFRVKVLRKPDGEMMLLTDMHHIISDGTSNGILIRDFAQSFGGEALKPLALQYKDYAVWQQEGEGRELLDRQGKYWKDLFKDGAAILELPTDFIRPQIRDFRGSKYEEELDSMVVPDLTAYCREHGVTLYTLLLASYSSLLSRYSGQEDIVVGNAIAGRDHSDLDGVLGMFVNSLAMRSRPEGEKRFSDYLEEVKQLCLDAFENQQYPFEELIDELALEGDMSRNPVFDTMLVVQNYNREEEVEDLGPIRPYDIEKTTAIFDITLRIWNMKEGLLLEFEYATSLYKEETIARLAKHLKNFVGSILENSGQRLSEIEILDTEEKNQLLHDFNKSDVSFSSEKCLHELIEEQVEKTPDAVAVVFGDESLTYGELNTRANQLAWKLREEYSVGPDVLVGMCLECSLEMIIGILGILKAGGAYLPMDPNYPAERIGFMLEDGESKTLLIKGSNPAELVFEGIVLDLEDEGSYANKTQSLEQVNDPSDLAYMIYTSGSTGKPKAVMVEHHNVSRLFAACQSWFDFNERDVWTLFHYFGFDFSVWEIFGSFLTGGRLVVVPHWVSRSPEEFYDLLLKEQVTVLNQTPSAFRLLISEDGNRSDSEKLALRYIIFGGEALEFESLRPWLQRHGDETPRLVNMYGITETTVHVTYKCIIAEDLDKARGSEIGAPIPDLRVYILDENRHLLPIGVAGEMYVGGGGVARGYLNRGELTGERFVSNPFEPDCRMYRTGDLARWSANGSIEYLGRIDDQVKIRGFRIELGEIESVLGRHPSVVECVAKSYDQAGDLSLVAYAVLNAQGNHQENSVRASQWSNERLTQWRDVFDETYDGETPTDISFNISGWNSSLTGKPIAEEEMVLWQQDTVSTIRALGAKRILEIGCGTGLLLFRLLEDCECYTATDLSETSIAYIKENLNEEQKGRVNLYHCEGTDFDRIEESSYDLVVINSVAQYFPNADYLKEVLSKSLKALDVGGKIFIGDVRDLRLHRSLLTATLLERVSDRMPLKELRCEVEQMVFNEDELLLDPRFFHSLRREFEQITYVEAFPKLGGFDNELSKFRYQTILWTSPGKESIMNWLNWDDLTEGVDCIRKLLTNGENNVVAVRGIPNARIYQEFQVNRELFEGPGFGTVGWLRDLRVEKELVEPESWFTLGSELGWEVRIELTDPRHYAVVLGKLGDDHWRPQFIKEVEGSDDGYANNPLSEKLRDLQRGELREYLTEKLPEYMVPSSLMIIDKLPLTSNGKVDRKALPEPDGSKGSNVEYLAPHNDVERILVQIWQDVLGVEKVGINDNFFDLGGHSLKAVITVAKIKKALEVDLSIKELFEFSSINELATRLAEGAHLAYLSIKQIEKRDFYPVSSQQKRLYALQQLDVDGVAYNMPGAYVLGEEVDLDRLRSAAMTVIDRHEALRTRFVILDDDLFQCVEERVSFEVEIEEVGEEEVKEKIADFVRSFDLNIAPLLRMKVLSNPSGNRILLTDIHHIVSDGTSNGILIGNFIRAFEGEVLEPLVLHYKDYAVWQQEGAGRKLLDQQGKYWKSQFEGEIPVLEFPTDFSRPQVRDFVGASLKVDFGKSITSELRAYCQKKEVTLYMLFLSCYQILLSRYSGQEDIIVGTPVAGRDHADLNDIFGMFVNILAIRGRPESSKKFSSYLEEVKEQFLEGLANQQYPFEELIDSIDVERDLSRNPLFDTVLVVQNVDSSEAIAEFGVIRPYRLSNSIAKFDITLSVVESEERLHLDFEYATGLFKEETIIRFSEHLKRVVELVVGDSNQKICDIDLLGESEREHLLYEFNDTDADYPKDRCIHELFEEQALRIPQNVALCCEGREWTYGELDEKSNRLARRLHEDYSVGPDVLVGLYMDRSLEMIVGILGILKTGGAYVPLDPTYPTDRIRFMIGDVGMNIVLSKSDGVVELPEEVTFLDLQKRSSYAEDSTPLPKSGSPSNLAYCLYTSGSTGMPKGVLVEHASVVNFLYSQREAYGGDCDLLGISTCSFAFDVSVWEFFSLLCFGGTLLLLMEDDVVDIGEQIFQQKITSAYIAPALLESCINYFEKTERVCPLKHLLVGVESIESSLLDRFLSNSSDLRILNGYGPSEATICATFFPYRKVEMVNGKVPIGRPLPNTNCYVLDASGRLCPIGVAGELCLSGAGLARGYLNRPELTAERFSSHMLNSKRKMYRTGDVAHWLANGNLEFLGRIDNQVKVRGFRVEPGEIESAALEMEEVSDVAVVVVWDNLACYYVSGDESLTAELLRERLRSLLPSYMVPSYFVELEELPTANGKLDRKALPEPEIRSGSSAEYVAPRDEMEQVLAEIWEEVLGVEKVGIYDNFFDLGGHSLTAISCVAKIKKKIGIDVPLVRMLTDSISELAVFCGENRPRKDVWKTVSNLSKSLFSKSGT